MIKLGGVDVSPRSGSRAPSCRISRHSNPGLEKRFSLLRQKYNGIWKLDKYHIISYNFIMTSISTDDFHWFPVSKPVFLWFGIWDGLQLSIFAQMIGKRSNQKGQPIPLFRWSLGQALKNFMDFLNTCSGWKFGTGKIWKICNKIS